MSTLVVSYDLHAPGRNYDELHAAIKRLGAWAHVLESCWVVKTGYTVGQVRDHLMQHIDDNDSLLVWGSPGVWASFNIRPDVADWLKAA